VRSCRSRRNSYFPFTQLEFRKWWEGHRCRYNLSFLVSWTYYRKILTRIAIRLPSTQYLLAWSCFKQKIHVVLNGHPTAGMSIICRTWNCGLIGEAPLFQVKQCRVSWAGWGGGTALSTHYICIRQPRTQWTNRRFRPPPFSSTIFQIISSGGWFTGSALYIAAEATEDLEAFKQYCNTRENMDLWLEDDERHGAWPMLISEIANVPF
jgi:hypothetical protein